MKSPTCVSLVEAVLRAAENDFLNAATIVQRTRLNLNQVSASLHYLRAHRAVDVVVERDGVGWWYALPPEQDTRQQKREARSEESKPRHRTKGVHGKRSQHIRSGQPL